MFKKRIFNKSRIMALTGLILGLMVVSLELTGNLNFNTVKIVTDFIIIVMFGFVIVFPKMDFLFIVNSMLAAFVNIRYGGNILGLLLYGFGLAMAMKQGFFREYKRFKIPCLISFFFASLFFQLQLEGGKLTFIVTLVNILIAVGLIFGFMYLFHDNLKEFYVKKPTLNLGRYNFTERQISCIKGCISQKKLQTIADEQFISESAIKREMLVIYKVLKVEDRHELYRLLMGHTVKFK
jgi:DNA-binding CsgD family transcriptional regulator